MHITIFSYGTWGDTRPHVVIGQALKDSGHDVQVVASPSYEKWVRDRGLDFVPLSVDIGKFTAEAQADVSNTLEQIRLLMQEVPRLMLQMGQDATQAIIDSDAFVSVEFALALLVDVLKINHVKPISINPAPLSRSREIPFIGFPNVPDWFPNPEAYHDWSYDILHRIAWSAVGKPRNQLHQIIGLPKAKFKEFNAYLDIVPALTIVSPTVIPRPDDWAEHFQMTGYIFDDDEDWTPPQDLANFLDAGEPPVYIGFGSMPDKAPQETTQMLIEGIQKAGKRGIILKGWAGLQAEDVPENIYILKYAPHNWLFPKMSAVVHHGGAGTTASGLLAGVPACIVPQTGDQPFWGRHVKDLGVGVDKIPRGKLNADNLAQAITIATETPALRENAQALAEKIRTEDGLAETMKWLDIFLKN